MPFGAADSPASRSVVDEHSTTFSKGADNSLGPAAADPEISQGEQKPSRAANAPATSDHHSSVPAGYPTVVPAEANKLIEDERADDTDGKVDLSGCSGRELSDVHLNIRLPNGVSLREKFTLTSALRVVKDYVDRNQTGLSSYNLAVPYPRKVFTDEGMKISLKLFMSRLLLFEFCLKWCYNEDMDAEEHTALLYIVHCRIALIKLAFGPYI